jgi:hypothetical protein
MSTNIKLEKFLRIANEVHGDTYDYSRVVIENSLAIKVEIFCIQCQEYFWQRANTHFIYGHSKCGRERAKQTNLKKYGVEYTSQSKEFKNTNMEKYGAEYPAQNKEVQQKMKETNLKKYGTEYPFQSKEVQEKIKQTNLEKYGFSNPYQSKQIQDKMKKTMLEKYGVPNPLQNPFIAEKQLQNSFKRKSFIFPSGKEIFVQGYEPFALNRLLFEEQIHEMDILTDRSQVPSISWTDSNGKLHIYYVDIFIPTQNRCIEVKSTWTYNQPNVQEKQEATLRLGYKYEIWVFDEKGELIKN